MVMNDWSRELMRGFERRSSVSWVKLTAETSRNTGQSARSRSLGVSSESSTTTAASHSRSCSPASASTVATSASTSISASSASPSSSSSPLSSSSPSPSSFPSSLTSSSSSSPSSSSPSSSSPSSSSPSSSSPSSSSPSSSCTSTSLPELPSALYPVSTSLPSTSPLSTGNPAATSTLNAITTSTLNPLSLPTSPPTPTPAYTSAPTSAWAASPPHESNPPPRRSRADEFYGLSGMEGTVNDEFGDATADLRICSSDGQIFCVHSYFLRASSSVFRETLEGLPPKPEGFTHEPITIDAPSPILSSFLHLIVGQDRSTSRPLSDVIALIALLKLYKCAIAHERLVLRLHRNLAPASQRLWTIFVLASHLDDVLLAKKALGLMSSAHQGWLVEGAWTAERVGEVTREYLAGLVNALLKIRMCSTGKQAKDGRPEIEWAKLAEEFTPAR